MGKSLQFLMKYAFSKISLVLYSYTYLNEFTHLQTFSVVFHYNDVIMGAMASRITSLTIVYSTVYSGAYQRKHQSSTSLAFVWGIHRGPMNSPHKWPVTWKMFKFDDVIMCRCWTPVQFSKDMAYSESFAWTVLEWDDMPLDLSPLPVC